jgi:hypothetical protein
VGTAAQKAGIKKIKTVQNGGTDILWGLAYSEQQTIVTGTTNDVVAKPTVADAELPVRRAEPVHSERDRPAERLVLVNPDEPDEILVSTKPVEGVRP